MIVSALETPLSTVGQTIVVETVRDRNPKAEEHPFLRELNFYRCLNKRQDCSPDVVQCFVALPDNVFISYCNYNRIDLRFSECQEREKRSDGFPGRLIRVKNYENPALIARWIQQITSALEYVEKLSFSHNDLHTRNCLLDHNPNLKTV